MPTLRIEHEVPDFGGWKAAFDSDPADRRGSGVRRYRVSQSVGDPNYVLIDLDFDTVYEAEGLLNTMREIWDGVGKEFMRNPQARITETVEFQEL
jgi:hypothetical protein